MSAPVGHEGVEYTSEREHEAALRETTQASRGAGDSATVHSFMVSAPNYALGSTRFNVPNVDDGIVEDR